ncbi:uncharacterized protein CG13380 isoform X2 [Ceratina calcarata]|nr:uncharacterized protein CG13380 isoform X2 [Ceratina calcarata]
MQANPQYTSNPSKGMGRGTGMGQNCDQCICFRPYAFVICNVCGYWTKGRIRYFCPFHPQTIFLCDITQCPQCKCYSHMLSEHTNCSKQD